MGCVVEKSPVFVFYDYHSIPVPSTSIEHLVHFVTTLSGPLTRFILCCDVRRTPLNVQETVGALDQCQIEHFSLPRLVPLLSERILRYSSLVDSSNGAIAIITDSCELGKTMKDLTEGGLRVVLFYPPDSDMALLGNAAEAFALPVHMARSDGGFVAIMEIGSGGKKEERFFDGDSKPLIESASCEPDSGWGTHSPPAAPPSASFTFQKNGFDSPSFAQQPKTKPNPFNKNPFQVPVNSRKDSPFGHPFGQPCGGKRNPFAHPKFPGFHKEKKAFVGTTPTRPIGPQCPLWENFDHLSNNDCQLWHPRKACSFFPRCRMEAEACFYAHPFCNGGDCKCGNGSKDPQLNHSFV